MKLKFGLLCISSLTLLPGCLNNKQTEKPKKEKKVVRKKKVTKKKSQRHAYARDWLTEDLTDYLA